MKHKLLSELNFHLHNLQLVFLRTKPFFFFPSVKSEKWKEAQKYWSFCIHSFII